MFFQPRLTRILFIFTVLFLTAGSIQVLSQPRFILKRTREITRPIYVQLLAGYNGVSDPAENLQDRIRDFDDNAYGGLMAGLQAGVAIDTIFNRPFWIGGEFYYHRYVNRYLENQRDVYYKGEPGSRVEYIEELHAIGFQVVVAYNIFEDFQLQLGGGVQYLYPIVNVPTEVVGLFDSYLFGTAMVGGRYRLLAYKHGSIDANIRAMQGFGTFGSFEVQSLLGFNFLF